MDPIQARQLAQQMIPNQAIAHDKADQLGITRQQMLTIDRQPSDQQLTQDELYDAILNNRVEVDPQSKRIVSVKTQVSFVDPEPSLTPASRPARPGRPGQDPIGQNDLFSGYHSQAVRDPLTQPLQVAQQSTHTPPPGQDFNTFIQSMDSPDKVAAFGRPFGNTLYNYDRAGGGEGPTGTQTPQDTFKSMSAICRDIGQLQAFALQENGYNAQQLGYKSQGILHALTTYEGKNGEGFGLVEYGRHYSPEDIAQALGRPALSHQEALLAVRPEAKLINPYSLPEADRSGYVKEIFYTTGHQLYNETLRLSHENSAQWSNQNGAELETALNEHWGIKLTANTGQSADPTAAGAFSAAVGYQVGDEDNYLRMSVGAQYRPNEGHHSIGANQWEGHESIVAGAHLEGQWTPFDTQLGDNHRLRTTVGTDLTGAFAFSEGEGSDASGGTTEPGWGLDNGLSAGLSHAQFRLGQHLEGRLSDQFSYQTEAFIAPDATAMAYGFGTGGNGLYSNAGVNASLHFKEGGFGAYVGGQYLLAQVNNLEATGASTGVSYDTGRLSLRADLGAVDSPEGLRLQTRQSVNFKITDGIDAFGYSSQEQIDNKNHGHYANPGGQNFGLGLRARF